MYIGVAAQKSNAEKIKSYPTLYDHEEMNRPSTIKFHAG